MKLQGKIISIVLLVSLSSTLFFGIVYILNQKKNIEIALEEKIKKNRKLVKGIVRTPLYYFDINIVKVSLEPFIHEDNIASIFLYDANGVLLLSFLSRDNPTIHKNDNIVITYDDILLGNVEIGYSQDQSNLELEMFIKSSILMIFIINIVIATTLILYIKRLTKPIKDLTRISVEISNGNLDMDVPIISSDEIGLLSNSFNKMRDSIKKQIELLKLENRERLEAEINLEKVNSELLDHRVHLEELVKNRTTELETALADLKKTQNQLIESEKMSSLGELVSGIAHEINTPVGIGVTAASHLELESLRFHKLALKDKITKLSLIKFINTIEESSRIILINMQRAAEHINSFKKIAVDQTTGEKRIFNLSKYLDEIVTSTSSRFKHTKHIININCDNNLELFSYPGAFAQIFTNLFFNSLIHGFEELEYGIISIDIVSDRSSLQIAYRDNGKGIEEVNIKKIFNPFFTTKRGQGGTGIGMSIVYNLVVQKLKGTIEVRNNDLESGLEFIIDIPIS